MFVVSDKTMEGWVITVTICMFVVSDKTMEGWVGRTREDSTEIAKKSISSHVARMTGGKLTLYALMNSSFWFDKINFACSIVCIEGHRF